MISLSKASRGEWDVQYYTETGIICLENTNNTNEE